MGSREGAGGARFDFLEWARIEHFDYPVRGEPMLCKCGSPAEAYFLRRFFQTEATIYDGGHVAHCRGVSVWVQHQCGPYRIDVVAQSNRTQLAIEIDGAHHWDSKAQIAADYRRERYLLKQGLIVIRFTGSEAIGNATMCWRDVFSVLSTRRALERSA